MNKNSKFISEFYHYQFPINFWLNKYFMKKPSMKIPNTMIIQ